MDEIREVTWGLWGVELQPWQAMQRLVLAGFSDPRTLLEMFAVIEGESGSYTKAWHANVTRDADKNIVRKVVDGVEYMQINSIDLGFIQRNVDVTNEWVEMHPEFMKDYVENMFSLYPELADAAESAKIGYQLWKERGFTPWYAYRPGTLSWKQKKRIGSKALAEYLLRTQVGKINGVLPELVWKPGQTF